jgi:BNR repeat-containing family member
VAALAAVAVLGATMALAAPALAAITFGAGGWSYFGDPRAVHRNGVTYLGWISTGGDVKIGRYEHATGRRSSVTLMRDLGRDDHNNPSLSLLADGRLRAYYAPHVGSSAPASVKKLRYRTTTRAGDISTWTRTRTIPTNSPGERGYSYPNPLRLRDKTYLFWRGADWQPTFSVTRDDGRTWSRARTLLRGPERHRPYVKYERDRNDGIHIAYTEGHPNSMPTSVYYLRLHRGRLYRAGGAVVGRTSDGPLHPSRGDRVYSARSGLGSAWILDVAVDRAGRPVLVYQRREREDVYRYARWTGSRWVDHPIVSSGRRHWSGYTGGVTLDHEDPSVIYLSRDTGRSHEVSVRATRNGGKTWSVRALTNSPSRDDLRPVSPRGLADSSLVLWMSGDYHDYRGFSTSVVGGR